MPKPIFVFGTIHSGTTLLTTILGVNSRCYLFADETGAYSKRHIGHLRKIFVKDVANIDNEYFIEKTPNHIFSISEMQEDFPQAKFIVVTRNPIDAVASIYKEYENFNMSLYSYSNNLTACLHAMKYENTFLVTYEDVVKNFDNTIYAICDFTGLQFEESMKNFHEHSPQWFKNLVEKEKFFKKRADQMKKPLFDDTGKGKEFLSKEQINQIEFDCVGKYNKLLKYNRIDK